MFSFCKMHDPDRHTEMREWLLCCCALIISITNLQNHILLHHIYSICKCVDCSRTQTHSHNNCTSLKRELVNLHIFRLAQSASQLNPVQEERRMPFIFRLITVNWRSRFSPIGNESTSNYIDIIYHRQCSSYLQPGAAKWLVLNLRWRNAHECSGIGTTKIWTLTIADDHCSIIARSFHAISFKVNSNSRTSLNRDGCSGTRQLKWDNMLWSWMHITSCNILLLFDINFIIE